MFKIITSLTAALIGLLCGAQTAETRNVSSFNKLVITDAVEVIYTQSEQFSVRAEASDALGLSTLLTESENNTLKITCGGNLCEMARVYITAPSIESIKALKQAQIKVVNGIKTGNFYLSLASGATFKGNVDAGQASLKAKSGTVMNIRLKANALSASFQGDAKVNLSGSAVMANIDASGNALCLARNFLTEKGRFRATGHASVEAFASDEIAVIVTDEARVRYFGFPQKKTLNPEAVAQARFSRQEMITEY